MYNASYGIPTDFQPLLFTHKFGEDATPPALVATSKLSSFVAGRFGPREAWRSLWVFLLQRLGVPAAVKLPSWTPVVGPAYSRSVALPSDAASHAVRASATWLAETSTLLSTGGDTTAGTCCLPVGGGASTNVCEYHPCSNDQVCPTGAGRSVPSAVTNKSCIQEVRPLEPLPCE